MPIIERKVFGDPSVVIFEDTVIVPKLLEIDPTKVDVEPSSFEIDNEWQLKNLGLNPEGVTAQYTDFSTEHWATWEEIGIARKGDWQRTREIIVFYLRGFESEDIFGEEVPLVKSGDFAIGPAIKVDKEKRPILLKTRIGIWYKAQRQKRRSWNSP